MISDLWQAGCVRLAAELPEQQFNTWIRPLPCASVSADSPEAAVLSVLVPNRFKLDWIRSQYATRIEAVLSEIAGKPVRLELTMAPREQVLREFAGNVITKHGQRPSVNGVYSDAAALAMNLIDAAQASAAEGAASASALTTQPFANHFASTAPSTTRHKLNSALTFDTLVAGRANQMARTAALHVAGAPGAMYNPLFIYGGVGLGKTHLVHAVGNALLKDRPDARVLYLHAEQFISDVVKNYQRKNF